MTKFRSLLALVALSLFASAALAAAPQLPVSQDLSGLVGATLVPSPAMTGILPCRVESSTPTLTAVSCPGTSGLSGVVYSAQLSSGAVTDLAIVLDSTLAALPANTATGYDKNGVKLSPEIISSGSSATGCTNVGLCGQWAPPYPIRFSNGLAAYRKGVSNFIIYYRLDPVAPSYSLP